MKREGWLPKERGEVVTQWPEVPSAQSLARLNISGRSYS